MKFSQRFLHGVRCAIPASRVDLTDVNGHNISLRVQPDPQGFDFTTIRGVARVWKCEQIRGGCLVKLKVNPGNVGFPTGSPH
jgi:hypothetical protein